MTPAPPLQRLSPTQLADLLTCPLRVKLTITATGDHHEGARESLHARVGRLCHRVLEDLATANQLADPDAFDHAWRRAIDHHARGNSPEEDIAGWPKLELTRLRLRRAITRIADLIANQPGSVLPEPTLTSNRQRLHGRPDIIVRGANHWLADLKTGRIRPTPDDPVHADYIRQLQFYAYLEHQTVGTWPTHAWLITLQGSDEPMTVEPKECEALARRSLDALNTFNGDYPDVPARTSQEHCKWCPHLHRCDEPWCSDMDWEHTDATLIRVTDVRRGAGDVWITGVPIGGTIDAHELTLRRIFTDYHPAAHKLSSGDTFAAVGLTWSERARAWQAPPSARLVALADPRPEDEPL